MIFSTIRRSHGSTRRWSPSPSDSQRNGLRLKSKAFQEHTARAPCDGRMSQLRSDWLSFWDRLGSISSLPSPFSGHTKLFSLSAAKIMTSLYHVVWAVVLLLPTKLVRSEHCNAAVHVPEATLLHRTQSKGASQQQQTAQLQHVPCTTEEQIQ